MNERRQSITEDRVAAFTLTVCLKQKCTAAEDSDLFIIYNQRNFKS